MKKVQQPSSKREEKQSSVNSMSHQSKSLLQERQARKQILSIYCPPNAGKPWHFNDLLENSTINYFAYGRHALREGLRLCGIGRGDRVLIPSYICRDVLSSVRAVDAEPLYYDVDEELQACLDPDSAPSAGAVMAVNYFGFPQELDRFKLYCNRTGATLIEDNAHGLFSCDKEGRYLGTRGDLAVFSLRKTLPLPNGAVLMVNRPDLKERQPAQLPFEPSYGDVFFNRKQMARRIIKLTGIGGAKTLIRFLRLGRRLATGSSIPQPDPDGENVLPEPLKCSPMLKKGIDSADPEIECKRRRDLYYLFDEFIRSTHECIPVFDTLPKGVVPYGYPFFCEDEAFSSIERELFMNGLLCITWPGLPNAVRGECAPFYHEIRLIPLLW